MGANEWRAASAWPPPEAAVRELFLAGDGRLASAPEASEPDRYRYDPEDPTPTVGGSLVSYVVTPGSCDVSEVQRRPDVLTYTTDVLEQDLDVVGPLQVVLYASSSAVDTDFSARLSDVFPDGRAIQLQHTTLRARYRSRTGDAEPLEPGRVYRLELDLWATANRFAAGHRLRLDLSSADFPKYDRQAQPADVAVFHDPERPSVLRLPVLPG
jgi:putative CocE/NonD family hydrolase